MYVGRKFLALRYFADDAVVYFIEVVVIADNEMLHIREETGDVEQNVCLFCGYLGKYRVHLFGPG